MPTKEVSAPPGPKNYGLRHNEKRAAIIRYLALVGRADRHLITNYIIARLSSVSFKLIELKHSGLVHNMKWSDGSKVQVLTPEGYRRYDYYQLRDKNQ